MEVRRRRCRGEEGGDVEVRNVMMSHCIPQL